MAYALSLSGLLTTFRHHFVQRPHAQCKFNCFNPTSRLRGNAIDSIHARAIIGRKRGQAGIGTKLVGVKLLNTLQQVSKLTSTN